MEAKSVPPKAHKTVIHSHLFPLIWGMSSWASPLKRHRLCSTVVPESEALNLIVRASKTFLNNICCLELTSDLKKL